MKNLLLIPILISTLAFAEESVSHSSKAMNVAISYCKARKDDNFIKMGKLLTYKGNQEMEKELAKWDRDPSLKLAITRKLQYIDCTIIDNTKIDDIAWRYNFKSFSSVKVKRIAGQWKVYK